MASAAPAQTKCGVTECIPLGIGLTCDWVMASWLAEKRHQIAPQVLQALDGDLRALLGLGKDESPLQYGLHEIAETGCAPWCVRRVASFGCCDVASQFRDMLRHPLVTS